MVFRARLGIVFKNPLECSSSTACSAHRRTDYAFRNKGRRLLRRPDFRMCGTCCTIFSPIVRRSDDHTEPKAKSWRHWTPIHSSDGRFTATAVTLRTLIFNAYELNNYLQLVGGPDWLKTTRWNLDARTLGHPTAQEINLMLQSFLASTFRLKLHKERRELPIPDLDMAQNGGLKLESAKGPVEVLVIDSVNKPTEN